MRTAHITIVLFNQPVHIEVGYMSYTKHPSKRKRATIMHIVPDDWELLGKTRGKFGEYARKAFIAKTGCNVRADAFTGFLDPDGPPKFRPVERGNDDDPKVKLKGCERCRGDLMKQSGGAYGCLQCGATPLPVGFVPEAKLRKPGSY